MSFLNSLVGGALGAEAAILLNGVVEKHGGWNGLLKQFEDQGLGDKIRSWVGKGENLPISPDQVKQALGSQTVHDLAAKVGISTDDLAAKLSELLPKAVDHATPDGTVPAETTTPSTPPATT
jgi:uncharacterized protein YidB (DUF937 family)